MLIALRRLTALTAHTNHGSKQDVPGLLVIRHCCALASSDLAFHIPRRDILSNQTLLCSHCASFGALLEYLHDHYSSTLRRDGTLQDTYTPRSRTQAQPKVANAQTLAELRAAVWSQVVKIFISAGKRQAHTKPFLSPVIVSARG
jgi:hypothetical protein